jgi:hypothetical protein
LWDFGRAHDLVRPGASTSLKNYLRTIDFTAPRRARARKPPALVRGVRWLAVWPPDHQRVTAGLVAADGDLGDAVGFLWALAPLAHAEDQINGVGYGC